MTEVSFHARGQIIQTVPQGAVDGAPHPLGSVEAPALARLFLLVSLAAKPFVRVHEHRWSISLPEWRVLIGIRHSPGVSGSELSLSLGLDKMAISRAVRVLEKSGYIARTAAPGDVRRQALSATPQGEALCAVMGPQDRALEDHLLAALAPHEATVFIDLLDRLIARAREPQPD